MIEIILPLFILSYVSLILIAIGIMQYKSKKPVGFYTGETPPKAEDLTDVTAWNHKHGLMLILYGAVIVPAYLSGLLIPHEILAMLPAAIVILGGIPVLILYHHKLKSTYYR